MLHTSDPSRLLDDRHWFLDVNSWARHTSALHGAFTAYAKYGVVLFAVLLLAGYLVGRGNGRVAAALWAPLATLAAVAINQPIARGVGEPRPFTVFPHALLLVHRSTDPSFASDHATMAGAVAVGLFLVSRALGLVATVAAIAMAVARVYVGAHFPVDVVAGLVLGGAVAGLGWLLARPVLTRLVGALQRSRLRILTG
jgi:undecaprenyl-diphosphatase